MDWIAAREQLRETGKDVESTIKKIKQCHTI